MSEETKETKAKQLLKTESGIEEESPKKKSIEGGAKLQNTKRAIRKICEMLTSDAGEDFKPEAVIKEIKNYRENKQFVDRLLYSEINSCFSTVDTTIMGQCLHNCEALIIYMIEHPSMGDERITAVIERLYDHVNLMHQQREATKNMISEAVLDVRDSFEDHIQKTVTVTKEDLNTVKKTNEEKILKTVEEAKIQMNTETKDLKKEYTAILGIFASIVLAITAGLTFSASVLENMHQMGIYGAVLVALIIGLVLINGLFGLFYYVDRLIYGRDRNNLLPLGISNAVLIFMIILACFAWRDNWLRIPAEENDNIESIQEKEADVKNEITTWEDVQEEMSNSLGTE